MVLELGPCPAEEAEGWTKFARRVIIEFRSSTEVMAQVSPDLLELWGTYIDRWAAQAKAASAEGLPFRWSESMDPEVGEFLLHGLDQCLHSPLFKRSVTDAELAANMGFTMHVVRAFVEGLTTEGTSCCHYVDQVLTSFGAELDA